MIKTIFFDTSAIVALFDMTDNRHFEARELMDIIRKDRVRLLLSDYILDESITAALTRIGHETAVEVGDFILSSAIIDFIWLDESLKRKAWDYFKRHDDKKFSFTDCTSFVLMNEMNIKQYFAFDDDFKQAGFVEFSPGS